MITYAGIGSRTITPRETAIIKKVAFELSKKDFILFSGNAVGSDIAFQIGSQGKCVLFLPKQNYNNHQYNVNNSLDHYDLGDSELGKKAISLHPNKNSLGKYDIQYMCRNYHQVAGYAKYPPASLVICCATYTIVENKMQVSGGTGQAVRIANSKNIPIINIRDPDWLPKLKTLVKEIIERDF